MHDDRGNGAIFRMCFNHMETLIQNITANHFLNDGYIDLRSIFPKLCNV